MPLPYLGEKFSDPILLPTDAPIPANIKAFKLVSRAEFEQAEMAAFDDLPKSLRAAFNAIPSGVIFQIIRKGLRFNEFTEDQVYAALLARAPPGGDRPLEASRRASRPR